MIARHLKNLTIDEHAQRMAAFPNERHRWEYLDLVPPEIRWDVADKCEAIIEKKKRQSP